MAAAAVAVGLGLRLAAARGDLWLDEIWSLHFATQARSALEVFTAIHHDNNHHLNTLWLMVGGADGAPLLHRLLAVVSGACLVALGAAGLLRRDPLEGAIAAVLLAGSRFLVHYGSEARGYGPAMACAMAAYLALDRFLATRRLAWGLAFASSAALGLLSHLTFACVLAGALAWGAIELVRRRGRVREWALLCGPAALLGLLWLIDVRKLAIGGGPPATVVAVLRELLATTLGLPRGLPELLALPLLGAAAYEVVALARRRDARAAFFATALVLAPAALLALRPSEYLAPRYFAVAAPVLLALLASAGARLAQRRGAGPVAVGLALLFFLAGSAAQLAGLIRDGRGHYRAAVTFLLAGSAGRPAVVGSDHDFRNAVVLSDQARRLGAEDRLVYVEGALLAMRRPEWFLLHDFEEQAVGPERIEVAGRPYGLVATFPYGGLSGWSWLVYRALDGRGR